MPCKYLNLMNDDCMKQPDNQCAAWQKLGKRYEGLIEFCTDDKYEDLWGKDEKVEVKNV